MDKNIWIFIGLLGLVAGLTWLAAETNPGHDCD